VILGSVAGAVQGFESFLTALFDLLLKRLRRKWTIPWPFRGKDVEEEKSPEPVER
jgi:hypothetical protein